MFNFFWVYIDLEPCLFSKFGGKIQPCPFTRKVRVLNRIVRNCKFFIWHDFFQKILSEWKPYMANIVCKSWNKETKTCYPNDSKSLVAHPRTVVNYPFINYLNCFQELVAICGVQWEIKHFWHEISSHGLSRKRIHAWFHQVCT